MPKRQMDRMRRVITTSINVKPFDFVE